MAEKSIAIIGAGLAGLSAGCFGQLNGYKTRIFEHHSKPGGVVATWRRGDYLIDGGIHYLMSYKPGNSVHELYRSLGVIDSCRITPLEPYLTYIDESDGYRVDITGDLDRLAQSLCDISPSDSAQVHELVDAAKALRGCDIMSGLERPQELLGFPGFLKLMWKMRPTYRYISGEFAKPVKEYTRSFRSQRLRTILNSFFLPEVPVWFVLMLLSCLADGQLGLIEGGSLDLVTAIEKRYNALGGQVIYKATVEKILVEDNRAVGIRLTNGEEHRADVIVSAADGWSTVYGMLEGRYLNRTIEKRYAEWKLFDPIIIVSFGAARTFPGESYNNLIKLRTPFKAGDRDCGLFSLRIFNYSPRFAPEGKTVLSTMFATDWDYWKNLRDRDRESYNAQKEEVAGQVLERLESRYPGISSQVEVTDVATPYTTWRYTLNYRGAFEGFVPTHEAMMSRPVRTLPGLASFYMAGQWVMPGGGVPPCLFSGRHVIEIMCRKDRKPFRTT